ncbi:Minor extracellular protease vpr [Colletotrichum tanaceti]|uniref:Minor extracellular protease vpr n=1 Tax=Colletotrichum tanaceti TaxID=1306861 RepID=A0A4U6XTE9_9PEZI|nr:Minor extracellular protease vpr [Colletotrichum tanaceti]TKW59069.1 Minor extracellular protease vpr [Colletotrichum tanaceti]
MRISNIAAALIALHPRVVAALRPPKAPTGDNDRSSSVVPRSFIIEYEPESHAHVRRHIEARSGDDITIVKELDSSVFSGAVVETEFSTIETLQELPYIVNVWVNSEIKLDDFELDEFRVPGDIISNELVHAATGVDKIHAEGIFGKGVKIGIIDTGVWYMHEALGGGFGEGFKVAGGYNFVGNETGVRAPNEDPVDLNGHGTYIAGIIAGNNFVGVAPEATLYAYKVMNHHDDMAMYSDILEAFLAAEKEDIDILNLSIGTPYGWDNHIVGIVASRLVDKGIIVVAAAGNNGVDGPFYPDTISGGKDVISVAAADSIWAYRYPFDVTFDGQKTIRFGYVARRLFPSDIIGWPIVALDTDTSHPADGCEPYPPKTPDLTGKIPLVRIGGCSFTDKQQHLNALGAQHILFYGSNLGELVSPPTSSDSWLGLISANQAAYLMKSIKVNIPITADFSPEPEPFIASNNPTRSYPSSYTSWGLLYDNQLKPDITAPGTDVVSTALHNLWSIRSGTSFATPYIAGIAALYITKHGGRAVHGYDFARTLARRIISSGCVLPWYAGTGITYRHTAPPVQVGNGLVDAWKVLYYDTQLEFKKIELNDTRYFSPHHSITVINNSKSNITYRTSFQASAGIDVLSWDNGNITRYEYGTMHVSTLDQLYPKDYTPRITLLSPSSFNLKPGEKKKISYRFHNPENLSWNTTGLPVYGGKILIDGSNGEHLSVPYAGVGADLRDAIGYMFDTSWPRSFSGAKAIPIFMKSSHSMDLSEGVNDFPVIYHRLKWGTRELRWDIFDTSWNEAQWTYPPIEGQNGYIGSVATFDFRRDGDHKVYDFKRDNPDITVQWPITNMRRNKRTKHDEFWWLGKLANGSKIEPGEYQWRFAALRPFGDPTQQDHWSTYIRSFTVTGKY